MLDGVARCSSRAAEAATPLDTCSRTTVGDQGKKYTRIIVKRGEPPRHQRGGRSQWASVHAPLVCRSKGEGDRGRGTAAGTTGADQPGFMKLVRHAKWTDKLRSILRHEQGARCCRGHEESTDVTLNGRRVGAPAREALVSSEAG